MIILRNVLFFLLMLIVGFFVGIQYANIVEAGKGQMLAGGAIVLGYGVISAGIFILISIFLYFRFSKKAGIIKKLNIGLLIIAICFILFFKVNYEMKNANKNNQLGSLQQLELKKSNISSQLPCQRI